MKKIIISFLAAAALLVGCQEDIVTWDDNLIEDVATGAPVVNKITPIDDEGTVLTAVSMGQNIAIYGNNFAGLKTLKFNDLEVDLKEVYVTNKVIYASVPRTLPEEISNTMTIVCEKGQKVYDVEVVIPELKIDGLFNEFSAAGAPARIMGDYFDIYELTTEGAVISVDGASVELIASTSTQITFIIPVGTPDGAIIELSGGRMEEPIQMKWRDMGYTLMVYGDATIRPDASDDGYWGGAEFLTDGTNAGDPAPLIEGHKFERVTGTLPAWNWTSVYGGGFNGGAVPELGADWMANPQDYQVKFEILTKSDKPITVGDFVLCDAQVHWNPASGTALNTYGEWKTVAFDLSFCYPTLAGAWTNFIIVYQPSADVDVDFSIANGRIVHK